MVDPIRVESKDANPWSRDVERAIRELVAANEAQASDIAYLKGRAE
jgi:hypothetical protein